MRDSIYKYISAPAPRYVLRLSIVESLLQKYHLKEPFEFIEVGPGRGDLAAYLTNNYDSCGTLFEISEEAIRYIIRRNDCPPNNVQIMKEKIEHYGKLQKVQLIVAFEVMEHIKNDTSFLVALNRNLQAKGFLMISVPAYNRKWTKQDEWAGHLRRYEKKNLTKILKKCGFEIIYFVEYGFPLLNLLRPLKNAYYRKKENLDREMATMRSGIDRNIFSRIPVSCVLPFYYPFMKMQLIKIAEGFGDGFVVLAKKIS